MIFQNGRSQAVRIPKEFRFRGNEVKISKKGDKVILEPLEREGRVISERDTQIASIAMTNKLILVTHNVKEFGRIGKLKVEDWATA